MSALGLLTQFGLSRGGAPPVGPSYDLALVVADALHATTAQTHGELAGLGHNVTIVEDSTLAGVTWTDYDAFVVCRANTSTTVGAALRGAINNGTPAVISWLPTNPPSNNIVTVLLHSGRLNFAGGTARVRSNVAVTANVVNVAHPITSPFALGNINVVSAVGYGAGTRHGDLVGTVLAYNPINTGQADEVRVAVIPSGTLDRSSVSIGAHVALIDFLGSGQALAADGLTILDRALQWVCGDLT